MIRKFSRFRLGFWMKELFETKKAERNEQFFVFLGSISSFFELFFKTEDTLVAEMDFSLLIIVVLILVKLKI